MSQLTPPPKFAATFIDADGYVVPAVGYKLYAYSAGTSTPKDTYTTQALSAANTNPVILNARGEAEVWLDGNYKFILKTDADVTVWTVDQVHDQTKDAGVTNLTVAGTLTIYSTAISWPNGATHSGNHEFTGNVVFDGNVALGDAAADDLTVRCDTVDWQGNPTHSGAHTWSGVQTFSAIPAGKVTGAASFTPTGTAFANCSAVTPVPCYWSRVGDVVTYSGAVNVTQTTIATLTTFDITLPIASAFANTSDLSGTASIYPVAVSVIAPGVCFADASGDKARISWLATASATSVAVVFTCQYRVL